MDYPNKPPASTQRRRHDTAYRYGREPHNLTQRTAEADAEYDASLAVALRAARHVLGDDHPLVAEVLRTLRHSERQRITTSVDDLTVALAKKARKGHERENQVAEMLGGILGVAPAREVEIPGGGSLRVDMLFLKQRLVVEENGPHHSHPRYRERDALLMETCRNAGLKLLTIDAREPLTIEHLRDRLMEVGIAA